MAGEAASELSWRWRMKLCLVNNIRIHDDHDDDITSIVVVCVGI